MTIILTLLGVVICCLLIWKVSDVFEDASEYLGRNMSNGVRGASLNAVASSMPELIISFIFLFKLNGADGYSGTIGTTAGSAVFNALIIPAAVILAVYGWKVLGPGANIPLSRKVIKRDGLALIIAEVALIGLISGSEITWMSGLTLIIIYLFYSIVLIIDSNNEDGIHRDIIPGTKEEFRVAIFKLVISVISMTIICYGLVWCVELFSEAVNMNLIFTSIILVAAASSVPDLVISLKDAKKGNYDDSIANALGSNIFDICVAHGLPLFIYTLMYGGITMNSVDHDASVNLRIALVVVTSISVVLYLKKSGVNKSTGYLFIALYLIFISYTMMQAFGIV